MKQYLVNNQSDKLIIFFTGWGCDEYEFEHLTSNADVLLLYDYLDLNLDFDFSNYKKIDLMAFSAGVFVASIMNFNFEISKKIAISGNPYLFDEHLGLSTEIQNILCNITAENADDFARNYLIKTDEEWKNFHHSKRTLESCKEEFNSLKNLFISQNHNIKDIYDFALMGENDEIFNTSIQKQFYKNRLKMIENARHNLFFRIQKYEQFFNFVSD